MKNLSRNESQRTSALSANYRNIVSCFEKKLLHCDQHLSSQHSAFGSNLWYPIPDPLHCYSPYHPQIIRINLLYRTYPTPSLSEKNRRSKVLLHPNVPTFHASPDSFIEEIFVPSPGTCRQYIWYDLKFPKVVFVETLMSDVYWMRIRDYDRIKFSYILYCIIKRNQSRGKGKRKMKRKRKWQERENENEKK